MSAIVNQQQQEDVLGDLVPDSDVLAVHPKDDNFPSTMMGNYSIVERLDYRHIDSLYEVFSVDGDSLWTYMFHGPFACKEEFEQYISSCFLGPSAPYVGYAIIDIAKNVAVGIASYLNISTTHKSVEVGFLTFSSQMKRSTISTEAMFMMAQSAFAAGYRRYEWKCNSLNLPSVAAAERLGFTFEGIFRQAKIAKGLNRDTAWFSIVDKDWPCLEESFDKYLDFSNFDSCGRQVLSLSSMTSRFVRRRFPGESYAVGPVGEVRNHTIPALSPFETDYPQMIGSVCRLERLGEVHLLDLYDAFEETGESLYKYLFYGPFESQEQFRSYMMENYVQSSSFCTYAILDNATAKPVGCASYLNIDVVHKTIEVGALMFSNRMRRSIIATEAMHLMAKTAFSMGYRRYEWKCNSLNHPSIMAAQRLGFTYEALFRQAKLAKGRNRDDAWFSIIDCDWDAIDQCFIAYLNPSNFDDKSNQITSLSSLTSPFVHKRFTN